MRASTEHRVAHLTETAARNHEALFPGYVSKLRETDPELIEVFDNLAFDEVLRHGALDAKTRLMAILASTIATQSSTEYRMMLGGALGMGVTPVEAKELVYQAVPYLGIAKVVDFIHATNEVLTARGIELPLEGQSTTTPETRYERGLAVQKEIFGDRIGRMYQASPPGQRHVQELLSANCFGDFWTRRGLDLQTRELLTFSMLAALGGAEPQLEGHIQGNLAVGNDKAKLVAVLTQLLPYIGYPRTLSALSAVNEVAPPSAPAAQATAQRSDSAPRTAPAGESKQLRITRAATQSSQQGPAGWFTGTVHVTMLFQAGPPARASGGRVTFEPGARTAWHTHPLGQTLIVTSGAGRVQRWGGPAEEIRPGDVVWIPPGVKHWHGAAPTTALTHLAIQEALDGKAAEWLEKVSGEQYGQ